MRYLVALLALFSMAAYAQSADVQAVANFKFILPVKCAFPVGAAIAQCPITKVQAFAATSPIADNSTMAPTKELGPTETSWTLTTTVPNGSTIYGRFKACAGACSAFSAQAQKSVLITVPDVPTGVEVTVTVTFTTQ